MFNQAEVDPRIILARVQAVDRYMIPARYNASDLVGHVAEAK